MVLTGYGPLDDARELVGSPELSDEEFTLALLQRLDAFESGIPSGPRYADLRACIEGIRVKLRQPLTRSELRDALDVLRQQIGSDK